MLPEHPFPIKPPADIRPEGDLSELAAAIMREHTAAIGALRTGVGRARACGELLIDAKSRTPHGEWLAWLDRHCPGLGERQAQKYMRLARHRDRLAPANTNSDSLFTIDSALAVLAQKGDPEPNQSPTDVGETTRLPNAVTDGDGGGEPEKTDGVEPADDDEHDTELDAAAEPTVTDPIPEVTAAPIATPVAEPAAVAPTPGRRREETRREATPPHQFRGVPMVARDYVESVGKAAQALVKNLTKLLEGPWGPQVAAALTAAGLPVAIDHRPVDPPAVPDEGRMHQVTSGESLVALARIGETIGNGILASIAAEIGKGVST